MKRLLPILLCLLIFISCENDTCPTGDLTVRLATAKNVQTGLIVDTQGNEKVTRTEVTVKSAFEYTEKSPLEKTAVVENGVASFTDLPIGNYTIVGKAYNKNNVVIASGETSAYIKQTDNNVLLDIDKLEGEGRFGFRIKYEKYGVPEANLDIQYKITDVDGNEVKPADLNVVKEPGVAIGVEGTLPSANYFFIVKVRVGGEVVDGYIQTFRTCPGNLTGGVIAIKGRPGSSTSAITVTNSTAPRMRCLIRKSVGTDGKVTLSTELKDIPEGLTQNDVSYQWYKNAEPMPGETNPALIVDKTTAVIHYSVIVKTVKTGSWSSDYFYI